MLTINMPEMDVPRLTRFAVNQLGDDYGEPVLVKTHRARYYLIWSPAGLRNATALEEYLFRPTLARHEREHGAFIGAREGAPAAPAVATV